MNMDMWKYYAITHADHTIMNPMSREKTRELVDLLRLPDGGRVLDLACGKGEFLCMVAERYAVTGTGVELSPFTIEEARRRVGERGLEERVELVHMDGGDYQPDRPGSLDLTSCIGASWIFHNHRGTLEALMTMTRSGGLVLVGEPFWRREPHPEYVKLTGIERELYGSHEGNVRTGLDLGLSCLGSFVSSDDDWDRYEGLQWQAAERYSVGHPDDPDVGVLLAESHKHRDAYLRWGRDCLGWALYLFLKP